MRSLKNFSQNDPRWKSELLGTNPVDTIGGYGCKETSFADFACYYGKDIDPLRLDKAFEAGGEFVNKELLPDDSLAKLYPDIKYVRSDDFTNAPADLAKLKTYMADPTISVMLCLQLKSSQHFVPVVDTDGQSSVTIADSWDGVVKTVASYGVTKTIIVRYIVYQAPLPTMSTQYNEDTVRGITNLISYRSTRAQGPEGNFEGFANTLIGEDRDLPTLKTTIENLNAKIQQDATNAQACDSEVNSLKAQLTTAQATIDRLQPEADKVGDLTGEINQLTIDRNGLQAEIIGLNKQITTLSTTSYTTAKSSKLVAEILRRLTQKLPVKK